MNDPSVSIIIPTYNGKDLLEQNLPSIVDAINSYKGKAEILVVDDGSQDDTFLFLKAKYPEIRTLQNEINKGFAQTTNKGIRESQNQLVILLNNDVKVDPQFISPLVQHFETPKIFAVSSKSLATLDQGPNLKRPFNESIIKLTCENGTLGIYQPARHDDTLTFNHVCTISHACGGFSAFHKEKLLTLGCFDDLYAPMYWEDVDLSYRAWKKGWYVLYEPKSVVYHRLSSTVKKVFKEEEVLHLSLRNQFLFNWKNLTDTDLLRQHARYMHNYLRNINIYEHDTTKIAFYDAMKYLMTVLRKRKEHNSGYRRTDREVIEISSNVDIRDLKLQGLS